jgi:two-component system, OmpR family, response regulator
MFQSPHILVVDGDRQARGRLHDCLQNNGYRVTAVNSGYGMRRVLDRKRVDLVVLDVQLPGEDGLTLCRDLCGRSQVPVMILSGLADEVDRIIGLEVGADDYVPKPFNPRELLSRTKAILRRTLSGSRESSLATAASYAFGDWTLDTIERALQHADGARVDLSGAEFRLLAELLAEAPRPLSRSRLIERLHDREFDPSDRSVDVRISRLRQLLRDNARSPAVIKTIHGRGYAVGVAVEARSRGVRMNTTSHMHVRPGGGSANP